MRQIMTMEHKYTTRVEIDLTADETEIRSKLRMVLEYGLFVEVRFTKKDGTSRVMFCTTNKDRIPEEKHPKGERENNDHNLFKVFDLDIDEWRSFRLESLVQVTGHLRQSV